MPLSQIMGAHFRPPAKAILENLPSGADLWLEREPSNDYDPNAIKIMIEPEAIPESQYAVLRAMAAGHGITLEEILEMEEIHLGYIPRSEAALMTLKWSSTYPDLPSIEGKLLFSASGKPSISWEWPPSQD